MAGRGFTPGGRRDWPERVRRSPRVSTYDWRQALLLAGRLAREALEDQGACAPEGFADRLMQLRVWLAELSAEAFPMAGAPSRLQAGGWLNWARAFTHPELGADARTACAPVLAAATQHLDGLLDLWGAAQTRASSRATGERFE